MATRAIGGITSSRCTNEETFLVQKLVRAGFGNNNVDTCARVCHSPTGYGLKTTFGTSAGTQDFDSVEHADVMIVIGANPTDGHPVFASPDEAAPAPGREADRHRSAPHRHGAHAAYRGEPTICRCKPGTNVAVLTAMAHVIVTEGLVDEAFVRERCDLDEFDEWAEFVAGPNIRPRRPSSIPACPAADLRGAARLYATGGNGAIYYGLGVTEHSQGTTAVMAIANLAMATGNIGRRRRRREPAARPEQRPGRVRHGQLPARAVRLSPRLRRAGARHVRETVGRADRSRAGPAHPQHARRRRRWRVQGGSTSRARTSSSPIPTPAMSPPGLAAMECVVVHDLFLNETANYAHVFLPGSTFLEKDGTFTNAERRIQLVRKVMTPKNGYGDWEVTQLLANAMGLDWTYTHPSQIMDEIAAVTPTFSGRLLRPARRTRLDPVAVQRQGAGRHADHAHGRISCAARASSSSPNMCRPTRSTGPRYPLLLTTGRILSQYNVGAQTRRTANTSSGTRRTCSRSIRIDAENRGISEGDWVKLASRAGETTLRATITDRVAPGVVYTTFHHPMTQANVVTTEYSDWATNCPEYKVTAVQVSPSNGPTDWQEAYEAQATHSRRIAAAEAAE